MGNKFCCYLFGALLLLCAAFSDAQAVRWDLGAPGSAGAVTVQSTGLSYLFATPGVQLNWCNHPANTVPCTNYATTFTSISLGTPCGNTTQVVLQGSNTCQATGDNFGNLGVWTAPNTVCGGLTCYDYTLTVNGVSTGPYVWVQGGGTSGITGATNNGGLLQTGTTLGMLTSCATNQVLQWSGTAWSCATISGGGSTQGPWALTNCSPDQTGGTFSTVAALTSPFFYSHWEFAFNPSSFPIWIVCTGKFPHALPGTGNPKIVLDSLAANDTTSGHTMTFATCDGVVSTTVNLASLTCASTQNFSTTTTAYAPGTLTFALQSAPVADAMFVVEVKATAISGLATNVLLNGAFLEWQ